MKCLHLSFEVFTENIYVKLFNSVLQKKKLFNSEVGINFFLNDKERKKNDDYL